MTGIEAGMGRHIWRIGVAALAVIGLLAVGGAGWLLRGGISARNRPGRLESALARRARSLAIPRAIRDRANPVPATAEGIDAGSRHFADHCAVCHGNDGSGETDMGRGLYPPPPDMRTARTQSLTDGELFFIIENGVRLTGMPAWGDGSAEGETASWHLVRFIRHLPALTPAELARMARLNPRAPAEPVSPDDFLDGAEPAPAPDHKHSHGGKSE